MLRIFDHGIRLCDGLHRREWLRLGGIGLGGLQLGALNAARNSLASSAATAHRRAFGRAKSVIVFGLVGGPPQHETWDPKPLAPSDIRGEFGTIETRTPNLRVGELMPRTALLTDKIAVLRAVVTNDNAHSSSGYQMLTGVPHQPLNQESAVARPPNLAPSMGALLRAVRSRPGELPAAMTIPEHIWNDGNFPWPGQDAGSLGPRFHPWLLHCDPSSPDFSLPGLQLPQDIPPIRFDERHSLLDQLNTSFAAWDQSRVADRLRGESRVAFDLIASSNARRAFQLSAESDSMRDRYGRSRFAQSVLLARRLVEAGVSLVQSVFRHCLRISNSAACWTRLSSSGSANSDELRALMPMRDGIIGAESFRWLWPEAAYAEAWSMDRPINMPRSRSMAWCSRAI
jgi:hypothetical protein